MTCAARRSHLAALAAALLTVLAPGAAAKAAGLAGPSRPAWASHPAALPDHVPGEVLVRFRRGSTSSERAAVRASVDARLKRRLLLPDTQVLKVVERRGGERQAVDRLRRSKHVRWAQLNRISRPFAFPNDPLFGSLWGMHNTRQFGGVAGADVDAPEAWDIETGSPEVVVAVVDEGVALRHPDLLPNLWKNQAETPGNGVDDDGNGLVDDFDGFDFADSDGDPIDFGGHGTHVAGTIAAKGNNAIGLAGIGWDTGIMPLRVIGAFGGSDEAVANGFIYAGRMGARVANASLGHPGGPETAPVLVDAVRAFPDTLYVVAAGNDGSDNDVIENVPCNIPEANLICVAATGTSDELASFSNYGATSVDLGAPGVTIASTFADRSAIGTTDSFATLDGWTVSGTPAGGWTHDAAEGYVHTGGYGDGEDRLLTRTSGFDLTGERGCTLAFFTIVDIEEGYDFLVVERSAGGGPFEEVGRLTGSVTDPTTLWVLIDQLDLRADGASDVRVRFRLVTDESVSEGYDGVFLDDVVPVCEGSYGDDPYLSLDGTSMASPHVAGAAALLFASRPTATVAMVREALLSSGDQLSSLAGKTVTGRRLDVRRSLDALAAMAAPAPSPSPAPAPSPSPAPAPSPSPSPEPGPARVTSKVDAVWSVRRGRTTAHRLLVKRVPEGARVLVSCRGRGCPFKRRAFRPRDGRVNLLRWFRRPRLRADAVVQVRVLAPGMVGKVVSFTARRKRRPQRTVGCLPPGATRPAAC